MVVFSRKKKPMEIPETRMRLLYRTFRENENIAFLVRFIKVPYMTRETCKANLARMLLLTPEVLYCGVPKGVFSDHPSHASLKAILCSRCSKPRKMTWGTGSEKNFVNFWAERPCTVLSGKFLPAHYNNTIHHYDPPLRYYPY